MLLRSSLLLLSLHSASVAAFSLPAVVQQPQQRAAARAARTPASPVLQFEAMTGKDSDAPNAEEASEEVTKGAPVTQGECIKQFSDVELVEQEAKLDALAKKWKRIEDEGEYEEGLRSGWGPSPERINGRSAMFFIIVGLVTEYYTGQSLPQQVYTMLQTMGLVE